MKIIDVDVRIKSQPEIPFNYFSLIMGFYALLALFIIPKDIVIGLVVFFSCLVAGLLSDPNLESDIDKTEVGK